MILLTSTNDTLALTTADDNSPSGVSIDVQVSYVDLPIATQLQEPGRENTIITSVTTTTILGSPGTSVYRAVKDVSIYNSSLTNACEITIIHDELLQLYMIRNMKSWNFILFALLNVNS